MKFNTNITASKIYAFAGIVCAAILAFIFKDPSVFVSVFTGGLVLFGVNMGKEAFEKREERKINEKSIR